VASPGNWVSPAQLEQTDNQDHKELLVTKEQWVTLVVLEVQGRQETKVNQDHQDSSAHPVLPARQGQRETKDLWVVPVTGEIMDNRVSIM